VSDREILEKYLNSASKITLETDIFPHGTKSLLTSVICVLSHNVIPNFLFTTRPYVPRKTFMINPSSKAIVEESVNLQQTTLNKVNVQIELS